MHRVHSRHDLDTFSPFFKGVMEIESLIFVLYENILNKTFLVLSLSMHTFYSTSLEDIFKILIFSQKPIDSLIYRSRNKMSSCIDY